MFVPPLMTDSLQPLDISVFAPFKQKLKSEHMNIITKGRYEHLTPEDKVTRFASKSQEARAVLLQAINEASLVVSKTCVLRGWCQSMGVFERFRKDKSEDEMKSDLQLMLTVHGEAGKARMAAEKIERDEWLAKVSKDPTPKPKAHGPVSLRVFLWSDPG